MGVFLRVADWASLLKLRLALAIAGAALAGYTAAGAARVAEAAALAGGVFLLACGAGALNNWQDRQRDATQARTRHRPLPAGRLPPGPALPVAAGLLAAGFGLLATGPFPGAVPTAAALAVLGYNALYTPLKARSLLALVPGVACGALPPAIGWLAAGADLRAPLVWSLMTVFGLWQPPHLWLIQLMHDADYRRAQAPSLPQLVSPRQLGRILFAWLLALAIALLTLPLGFATPPVSYDVAMCGCAAFLALWAAYQCLIRPAPSPFALAAGLNSTVAAALLLTVLAAF